MVIGATADWGTLRSRTRRVSRMSGLSLRSVRRPSLLAAGIVGTGRMQRENFDARMDPRVAFGGSVCALGVTPGARPSRFGDSM
jgi:hypothetical protein